MDLDNKKNNANNCCEEDENYTHEEITNQSEKIQRNMLEDLPDSDNNDVGEDAATGKAHIDGDTINPNANKR